MLKFELEALVSELQETTRLQELEIRQLKSVPGLGKSLNDLRLARAEIKRLKTALFTSENGLSADGT